MRVKKQKRAVGTLCILGMILFLSACAKEKEKESEPSQTEGTSAPLEQDIPESDVPEEVSDKTISITTFAAVDASCAPGGIAAMADGALLITDAFNKRIWRVQGETSEIYAGAETVVGVYGEPVGGYHDAAALSSFFLSPCDIVEFLGGWAVSDTDNNAIRLVRDEKVKTLNIRTPEGSDTKIVLERPTGLAVDAEGNLYIADTGNGAVRKVSSEGIVVTEAEGLKDPMGLCWKEGVLYVAETGANRIVKIEDGNIQVVAGNGEEGLEDGQVAQAAFAAPRDVVVGEDGAIYVADTLNSAVRRIWDGQVETVMSRDMAKAEFGLVSPSGLLAVGEQIYVCDSFSKKILVMEWK